MPKLEKFQLDIKTGSKPGPDKMKFNINGFPLEFETVEGGVGSGETAHLVGCPQSFPHSLTLAGPEEGSEPWEIESVTATYECMGGEPYVVRMGSVTLDDNSDLNIWHERPAPVFDV